jgi:hypothetical protein
VYSVRVVRDMDLQQCANERLRRVKVVYRTGRGTSGGQVDRTADREIQWQARWFSGEFGRDFVSVGGARVRVVQFGVWNRMAGPDFLEAAICVDGGAVRRGAIELDMDASDWEAHRHSLNPDYREVVLHVFVHSGRGRECFTRTDEHRNIVQVCLGQPDDGIGWQWGTLPRARPGRCKNCWRDFSLETARNLLVEAARHRFARKAANFFRIRDAHGAGEALYQLLASGLGYAGNELPFTLIAQRLPVALLTRSGPEVASLLFGVSGMIPQDFRGLSDESRRLARELWDGWWASWGLLGRSQLQKSLWRMGAQRPMNHPQRRVAALGLMVRHWKMLLRLWERREWGALRSILLEMQHPFWSHHFTFESAHQRKASRILGTERVDTLFLNVFLPASGDWNAYCRWEGSGGDSRCRTAVARMFAERRDVRDLTRLGVHQQGLLELYEGYCGQDASECERCVFPEQTSEILGKGGASLQNLGREEG